MAGERLPIAGGNRTGDVVLFVAGEWDVQDMLRAGQWTNITEPSFQRYELAQMRQAVRIGVAHGAHFDFATMPATGSGKEASIRRVTFDRLLDSVAKEFPATVSVIDYGGLLSPGGAFHEFLDGVQVRAADGVHTPAYVPGNIFANNTTEAVAHAFYNWLSPRLSATHSRIGSHPIPMNAPAWLIRLAP